MSPSEAQLRAALREGAGRGLDADAIIAKAERYRRARRQRLINGAAAAAVVCVFVGGGSWFAARTGDDQAGGSSGGAALGAARSAPAQPPAGGGKVPAPRGRSSAPSAATTAPVCPRTPKPIAVPSRATTGQAAALLPTGLSAITACGYSPDSARPQHSEVFSGARANGLAARLNRGSARPVPSPRQCSAGKQHERRLVLFPRVASGVRPKAVDVTVRCAGVIATNGAVTRYLPDLPRPLSPLVR